MWGSAKGYLFVDVECVSGYNLGGPIVIHITIFSVSPTYVVPQAVEMFTELRDFELAKKFMANSSKDASDLIALQADWAMTTNDPQAAW